MLEQLWWWRISSFIREQFNWYINLWVYYVLNFDEPKQVINWPVFKSNCFFFFFFFFWYTIVYRIRWLHTVGIHGLVYLQNFYHNLHKMYVSFLCTMYTCIYLNLCYSSVTFYPGVYTMVDKCVHFFKSKFLVWSDLSFTIDKKYVYRFLFHQICCLFLGIIYIFINNFLYIRNFIHKQAYEQGFV